MEGGHIRWEETCHLVSPWMAFCEGQLVISWRAGQPVGLSMAGAEYQQLGELEQDRG